MQYEPVPVAGESREGYTSRLELNIFRHGDKEKDPSKTDQEIELTTRGGELVARQATLTNITRAVAYGSPRIRTRQTAALKMAGALEGVTGHEGARGIIDKVNALLHEGAREETRVGSKVSTDRRLDFTFEPGAPYGDAAYKAFGEGRLMKFFVEESDKLAREAGDIDSTTYSRAAGGIAELVRKNVAIAREWDKLVKGERAGAQEYDADTLERFAGTHQSVGESFLIKVVEKMRGEGERDKLVAALGNQGFDPTEGFKIEILNVGEGEPKVFLDYKKEKKSAEGVGETLFQFSEEVPREVLEEIIEEGKAGEMRVAA